MRLSHDQVAVLSTSELVPDAMTHLAVEVLQWRDLGYACVRRLEQLGPWSGPEADADYDELQAVIDDLRGLVAL